jgi:uncharacterized protein
LPTNNKPNRLIAEKSPYLLQHAYNPVDWYPWGEEAFEKAKRENKPIFLSIGYSTCHWCHVMAHESFEDEEVAKILNEKYVSIKVDREERPDIDSIYMRVCQMLTGHGGWPLSVFLTPDQKPFFAGTYFPKESKYGRPGFIDVITQLYDKFVSDPESISRSAEEITKALTAEISTNTQDQLQPEVLQKTFRQLANSFDSVYGGFGGAPKFPIPHMLMFLLRYYKWTKNEQALLFVEKTLDGMARGGIYDHIGFGFARYSTDNMWLVPHFEKMLYDNALLLMAYTETYQLTKREKYKVISEQIIEFVERELTDETGAFYSAIDADSEGIEGKYYVWAKDEILNVLGNELGELFCDTYDIREEGNFEGQNIPNLVHINLEKVAAKFNLTMQELTEKLETAREQLFKVRLERTYPHLDDKILTSWNALMIAALAKAGKAFQNQSYIKKAVTALQFVEEHLIQDGRVMVRYRDGEVKNKGFIDDYAFLLWAYLELYEATLEIEWLKKAKKTAADMVELFWDEERGGFYFTGKDGENLIVREKEVYDGAIPSGNSVAALQLLRLAHLTGDLSLIEKVTELHRAFKRQVESYPSGHTYFLQSLLAMEAKNTEIVILGNETEDKVQKLLSELQQGFYPFFTILYADNPDSFKGVADFATQYKKFNDSSTVYICKDFTCDKPTTDLEKVIEYIHST